jgi:hypothetical protein
MKMQEEKFPIVVTKAGLHICIDDILTAKEASELIKAIQDALSDYWKTY